MNAASDVMDSDYPYQSLSPFFIVFCYYFTYVRLISSPVPLVSIVHSFRSLCATRLLEPTSTVMYAILLYHSFFFHMRCCPCTISSRWLPILHIRGIRTFLWFTLYIYYSLYTISKIPDMNKASKTCVACHINVKTHVMSIVWRSCLILLVA